MNKKIKLLGDVIEMLAWGAVAWAGMQMLLLHVAIVYAVLALMAEALKDKPYTLAKLTYVSSAYSAYVIISVVAGVTLYARKILREIKERRNEPF